MESGFKVFRREIIQKSNPGKPFGFEPEIIAKVSRLKQGSMK